MSAKHGTGYTLGFAAAVCLVCSVFVCLAAVMLKDRQDENAKLDKQKNVLMAAGLMEPGETLTKEDVVDRYKTIESVVVDLATGKPNEKLDAASYDQEMAEADPATSHPVEPNGAKQLKVPNNALVYKVMKDGKTDMLVLPIKGKGLWSTLYGFLALDKDTTTVRGVSFYKHAETPGLGGEISNPQWTALWVGRKVLDENFEPAFKVIKGSAGTVEAAPYNVDGLSGATLTCNGVTGTVQFWVGEQGFGPFLKNFREGGI